jgi:peptidoglycan/LPS O-acetylase OafA/YrhL
MTVELLKPATPPNHHRFHLLDALRGVAAILVIFWHVPKYLLSTATQSSFLAVDFFFCLSGFVIAFSYEKRLRESLGLREFMAARLIRLYPMYLLGISLGIVVLLWLDLHFQIPKTLSGRFSLLIALQLFMLPTIGVWKSRFAFPLDFPAWSLFFEIMANIGFAILVRKGLVRNRLLIIAASVLSLFWVMQAMRGGSLDAGWSSDLNSICKGIVRVSLSFTLGVLVFRLFRKTPGLRLPSQLQGVLPSVVAILLIVILLSPLAVLRTTGFHLLTVILLFPALVYCGSLIKTPAYWTAACVLLGNISYPIYLLHAPITEALNLQSVSIFATQHHAIARYFLPTVILLATGIAYLAMKFYDVPVRKLLTRRYNSAIASKITVVADCTRLARQAGSLNKEQTDAT